MSFLGSVLRNILKLDYESILRLKWDLFPTFFNERNHKFAGK